MPTAGDNPSTEREPAILHLCARASEGEALRRILQREGLALREVRTASDALRAADGTDLVLLDGEPPDLSGEEFCRRLRARPRTRTIPVVRLATDAAPAERDGSGALSWPESADPALLVATMKALVRARRAATAEHERAEEDRERLLRQIEAERARLETLLRQMPSGVIIAEAPSGRLAMINEQVEAIFHGPFRTGGGIGDYLQYPAFRPTGEAYRPEEFPLARSIASGEVVAQEEIHFVRGDGARATVLVSSAPIRDRDGRIVAGILTLNDVTDRSVLEQQFRQAQKMEAMGRLAGGVAHDFNNLLTIIGGYGQMAMDSLKVKDPARKDLEAVLEAAARATDLAKRLLTFSRRQPAEPKVLDLNRLVLRINRMLDRVIGEDVELVTRLEAEPARIKADPAQIEQVLLNLAVNARDAMPKGGRLTIETAFVDTTGGAVAGSPREPRPGRYVTLAMTDTGTGMDAETQSRLFEPFFTTKAKGKGTGLGLSTVYGIVKQGDGEIVVESEVGRGTAIRIYFPCVEETARESARPRVAAPRRGSETILIVEDEASVRSLASEMLGRQGYTVLVAESEAEALRIWQERGPSIDLLLADVVMPQASGPELAARFLAGRPDLKVLYVSGYAAEVLRQHGIVETQAGFLHKPFTAGTLARKVRAALDEKGKP